MVAVNYHRMLGHGCCELTLHQTLLVIRVGHGCCELIDAVTPQRIIDHVRHYMVGPWMLRTHNALDSLDHGRHYGSHAWML